MLPNFQKHSFSGGIWAPTAIKANLKQEAWVPVSFTSLTSIFKLTHSFSLSIILNCQACSSERLY